MSKLIRGNNIKGFTLIELLVVIAIIGLLSTAIMGPVQTGLKKGRDTRKISDLTQVQGSLLQYAGDNNGTYPVYLAMGTINVPETGNYNNPATSSLAGPSSSYMKADDKMVNGLSAARDRFMYTVFGDAAGNLVGYHLGVSLENQNASLQGDIDCMSSSTAPANAAVAAPYVTAEWGAINMLSGCTSLLVGSRLNTNAWNTAGGEAGNNGNANSGSYSKQDDFNGAGKKEGAGETCTSKLDTCIFDITPN